MKPLPDDLDALAAGGKGGLARALTVLEASPDDPALARLLGHAVARPRGAVLGITGPPGVGKSTLTRAVIAAFRARGQTVAVIAVDPSSRRSGGALLGDRNRMETDPEDAGVFVRSMAARRRLGGLADLTYPATVLMRALFDIVIVETVGVGQSETEIADCADLVIFCAQPGSGDALQFMKAGVMEVPDIIFVTKGDMGAVARRAAADLKGAVSLASEEAEPPAVMIVSAMTGDGLGEALERVGARISAAASGGELARRRAEQSRLWAESRIAELYGRVGLESIRDRFGPASNVFEDVARFAAPARAAIAALVKKV